MMVSENAQWIQKQPFFLEKVSILEVDHTVRKLFLGGQELSSPKSLSLLFNSLHLARR
jgi:hypothetical protein